jgi:hypothetical protein
MTPQGNRYVKGYGSLIDNRSRPMDPRTLRHRPEGHGVGVVAEDRLQWSPGHEVSQCGGPAGLVLRTALECAQQVTIRFLNLA